MTENKKNVVNSGVQANVGMEFQKHCTLYLFLDKYEELKNKKYFIILEHLEDIVFGYFEENDLISEIETYQAKKATNKWTLNNKLLEILKKISQTSQSIIDDKIKKSKTFNQKNYFATNNTIELKSNQIKGEIFNEIINETNELVAYSQLNKNIQDKIKNGSPEIIFSDTDKTNLLTLNFNFIDLSRNPKSQLEQLYGKFESVFGKSVEDHKASIQTLLTYLREIESKYNQGSVAELSDLTKRIESKEINKILNILTTKKLAYTFWREKENEICKLLNISIFDKQTFKLHFQNSFDNFKDLKESEHKKIYDFVFENKSILQNYSDDGNCILAFYQEFQKKKTTTYRDLQLKATISAAYIEIINTL